MMAFFFGYIFGALSAAVSGAIALYFSVRRADEQPEYQRQFESSQ